MDIEYKWYDEIDCSWISIDINSWINHFMILDEVLTDKINEYESIEEFVKTEFSENVGDNTYNHNEIFDTTLDYYKCYNEENQYYVIKFHQGGDVRGNYSSYYVYRVKEQYIDEIRLNSIDFICSECKEIYSLDINGYLHPELDNEHFNCCGKRLEPIFD